MASRSLSLGFLSEAMAAIRASAALTSNFMNEMAVSTPVSVPLATAQVKRPTRVRVEHPVREARSSVVQSWNPVSTVPVTIHNFPSLEPLHLERWSVQHLYLPLRRDILHHAVVYEGDKTRQGSASSKTRWEVHGSHRKMYAQKGTGRARRGDKQSPLLRGGGKSFGPRPRDFSSKLNRKVYDKAWRTALSHRYRQGELIICSNGMELNPPRDFLMAADKLHLKDGLREAYLEKYMKGLMDRLCLGRDYGRTLFVTSKRRDLLFEAMELVPSEGMALDMDDVDVKDLLQTGRVIMERGVLEELLRRHQSDLVSSVVVNGLVQPAPAMGERVLWQ
ncbi:ribosomal protein [Hirsutella rhossiliensis]|uniref:Large ribosomal subunit protein uL4m n=1 Tax=Hirsutella rhossiliensis TaxID=111463 RepID=A0A9P8MPN2_9HYPO|nr:ribosomal protein l4/L1 family domain-containing protein [Hirsutella rhossiliensis]KAH0958214.1 ribosomal protein l4/L1 family domain-containing protein [Hirsutella rhossiliensis]